MVKILAKWMKALCDTNACVELGLLDHGDYAIRNSAFRARTITFTRREIVAFLHAAKNGDFDVLLEQPK